jgi:toxin ParE1/3/4
VWTEIAWSDLEQVAEYIAHDSPYYAAALVRKARDAARSLSEFPNRGRMVPEFGQSTVRETYVGRYRLIYAVRDDEVQILAFIHGARDLPTVWEHEHRQKPTAD